tara:strand:+ start:176 stop:580 length:405 start_codon:yes stop_codon:yes gene_type:complete
MQELQKQKKAILGYAIDQLDSEVGIDCYIEDLHHYMFNQDYFIIGTYKAKKFLGDEVFNVIETIKEYEQFNFGEISTDFTNPEQICNMIAYILGYEILNNSKFYQLLCSFNSYDYLTKFHLDLIKKELELLYNA